jgi:hypothetical protein
VMQEHREHGQRRQQDESKRPHALVVGKSRAGG